MALFLDVVSLAEVPDVVGRVIVRNELKRIGNAADEIIFADDRSHGISSNGGLSALNQYVMLRLYLFNALQRPTLTRVTCNKKPAKFLADGHGSCVGSRQVQLCPRALLP